jgi:signal transduction histidine kinase
MILVLAGRIRPAADAAGVRFKPEGQASGELSNRNANLVMLILENLLQNAVQATPCGRSVKLKCSPSCEGVRFEVTDEGPGVPPMIRPNLFLPTRSSKPGGNGLGLAISQHLARHLGTELRLERSDARGSVFVLELPAKLLRQEQNAIEPACMAAEN